MMKTSESYRIKTIFPEFVALLLHVTGSGGMIVIRMIL